MQNETAPCGLRVGAARVALEYPPNFFPHTSFRGRYFTGKHDDLHARAVFVESHGTKVLFLSLELGDVGEEWLPGISEEAGVPPENIFLTASHTHASPHVNSTWPEDVKDVAQSEAFAALCRQSISRAIAQAQKALRPGRMRYGTGVCHINVNRDYRYTGTDGRITSPYIQAPNPGGISDKTAYVLLFEDLEGQAIAYLVNYAVHSNVTFYQTWNGGEGMLVSSDLAGAAMRYVETHSDPGAVAMFVMAAAADQMPRYLANHRVFDQQGNAEWEYYGREAGLALMDAQAVDLGGVVLRAAARMAAGADQVEIRTAAQTITAMGKVDGADAPKPAGGDSYASQYKETLTQGFQYTPTQPLTMRLNAIRLGGLVLVGIPAEIVTSIGADIKRVMLMETGAEVMIVTQCNGSYSYISDEEGYEKMTFEAVASHFMPGVGAAIVQGVAAMLPALWPQ